MAVCGNDKSIPRIEYYSNPNIKYKNLTIGTDQTNYNAKTIANAACRVSHYLNTEEPTVYLLAPTWLCPGEDKDIYGVVSGVPGPINYYWQTSTDGLSYTPNPPVSSSSSSITITAPDTAGQSIWVRLAAGSSGGPLVTVIKMITANDVDLDCNPHFIIPSKEVSHQTNEVMLSPNPANSEITLSFQNISITSSHICIYNSLGRAVKKLEISNLQKSHSLHFDVSDYPIGIYWVTIQGENLNLSLPFAHLH